MPDPAHPVKFLPLADFWELVQIWVRNVRALSHTRFTFFTLFGNFLNIRESPLPPWSLAGRGTLLFSSPCFCFSWHLGELPCAGKLVVFGLHGSCNICKCIQFGHLHGFFQCASSDWSLSSYYNHTDCNWKQSSCGPQFYDKSCCCYYWIVHYKTCKCVQYPYALP